MIRKCNIHDKKVMYEIINDSALAYKGIIPEDRWHEPYMSATELDSQINEGVHFWGYEENGNLIGIMGIQNVKDVTLIRHAYIKSSDRKRGIGSQLLKYLEKLTDKPVLIGTWAAATWAISFYEKNGYRKVTTHEKDKLLRKYWNIPERQIVTSVVLADAKYDSKIQTS